MIKWEELKGEMWALSDEAPWMSMRVAYSGSVPRNLRTRDGLLWAFGGVAGADKDRRLDLVRVSLGMAQHHAVAWSHQRARIRRGWVRRTEVYVKYCTEWPQTLMVPTAAVNPSVQELVGHRIGGGKRPWWRYSWSKETFFDESELAVFGVARAAWYCLRKERSIREGVPGYPEAARRGLEWRDKWREGKEPTEWL